MPGPDLSGLTSTPSHMTTNFPTRLLQPTPLRVAAVTLCLTLGGCTVVGDWWSSEKTDYRGQSKRTQPLEVPPDLTQLQKDSRYLPQGGVVTASDLAKGGNAAEPASAAAAGGAPAVALSNAGKAHLVRQGEQRWLATTDAPEAVWTRMHDFWTTRGFSFTVDDAKTGILETDWREDRTKLPSNFIHDILGKVVDGLFDSGLRDRFRTRLERTPDGGTEIYLTHFGATEEIIGFQKSETQWVPRPSDPNLEAKILSEMMLSLGGVPDTSLAAAGAASAPAGAASGAAVVTTNAGTGRARLVPGQPGATMQMDDNFDRSWRRVGLALDHGGFTVEDRDRAQGLYYVRFVDAKEAAKDEAGFVTKFKGWFGMTGPSPVGKYRISIKGGADSSTVTVLNDQGQADNSENAQRIVSLLVDELK
jgi:outer membrane protein assembly factor BamC